MRVVFIVILMVVTPYPAVAKDAPSPAAEQFQALLDEYEREGGARTFAKRFLTLAGEHPKDPAAADAA